LIKLASRFINKGFSLPSGLGHWCQKKTAFTVFRKILDTKEGSFEQLFKLDNFLSVFSEESYIFGSIANVIKTI
jgi:hypothetical protein